MTIIGGTFIGIGVVLILLAGVGIVRFPDVLIRANAATKAAGLGVAAVLIGVAVVIGTPAAFAKLGAAAFLQFLTAPVAGHIMGRAAYRSGAPLWEGTEVDDLRQYYEDHSETR